MVRLTRCARLCSRASRRCWIGGSWRKSTIDRLSPQRSLVGPQRCKPWKPSRPWTTPLLEAISRCKTCQLWELFPQPCDFVTRDTDDDLAGQRMRLKDTKGGGKRANRRHESECGNADLHGDIGVLDPYRAPMSPGTIPDRSIVGDSLIEQSMRCIARHLLIRILPDHPEAGSDLNFLSGDRSTRTVKRRRRAHRAYWLDFIN
jgi:hypothetical protein